MPGLAGGGAEERLQAKTNQRSFQPGVRGEQHVLADIVASKFSVEFVMPGLPILRAPGFYPHQEIQGSANIAN